VTLRRLLNFSLGPALKSSFEQILSAPIIVECVFAELGVDPHRDVLARVGFDGTYHFEDKGVVVVHTDRAAEGAASAWLRDQLDDGVNIGAVRRLALAAWRALTVEGPFVPPVAGSEAADAAVEIQGRVVESALLDRRTSARVRYRMLQAAELS
jgi:hypothetical protein